jgi:hypothetical protein
VGPLSLVSTTEELSGRKSSGSGLENRDFGSGRLCDTPKKVGSGPLVGIIRWRTKATKLMLLPPEELDGRHVGIIDNKKYISETKGG